MSYCFEHKTYKCEFESGSENKKSELPALAPTLTLFVAPSGLPESLRFRDRLLALPSQDYLYYGHNGLHNYYYSYSSGKYYNYSGTVVSFNEVYNNVMLPNSVTFYNNRAQEFFKMLSRFDAFSIGWDGKNNILINYIIRKKLLSLKSSLPTGLSIPSLPLGQTLPTYLNSILYLTGQLTFYTGATSYEYVNGVIYWVDNYSDGSSIQRYSWKTVAGPWGNGPLPPGNYTLHADKWGFWAGGLPGYCRDGVEFWIKVFGHYDIHPDEEPVFGSRGCPAIQESGRRLSIFLSMFISYIQRNGEMTFIINY
jgi:hypothetical protein